MATAMCTQCGKPIHTKKDQHYYCEIEGATQYLHPACWDSYVKSMEGNKEGE